MNMQMKSRFTGVAALLCVIVLALCALLMSGGMSQAWADDAVELNSSNAIVDEMPVADQDAVLSAESEDVESDDFDEEINGEDDSEWDDDSDWDD